MKHSFLVELDGMQVISASVRHSVSGDMGPGGKIGQSLSEGWTGPEALRKGQTSGREFKPTAERRTGGDSGRMGFGCTPDRQHKVAPTHVTRRTRVWRRV